VRKWFALAMCLGLLGAIVAGCGSSGDSSTSVSESTSGGEPTASGGESSGGEASGEPIVLGAAVGETGFMAAYDGAPLEALKLAIKERNAEGGIDGRPVELLVKDTHSDKATAKTAADELMSEGVEMLVVSCDFDYGAPAAQVAQQEGKISFSLCAQSVKFGAQGIGPYAYTPAAAAVDQGATTAEWVLDKKHWDKGFVLEDSTLAYDEESCTGFNERFTERGGEIVGEATFQQEDASVASQIAKIKAASPQPEFIRICSVPPGAATAIKQIRAAGINLPIVGPDSLDGTYWMKGIPNLSDVYYSAVGSIYGDDPDPQVNAFVKSYEKATGEPPATAYVLFGPTLFELYATAVEEAGSTEAAAVAEALNGFSKVPTLVGATTYTEEIHIALDRPFVFIGVTDGQPKYLETLTASEPAPYKVG